jgi:sodium-dependent dicarboxylate transporter 2/3/5
MAQDNVSGKEADSKSSDGAARDASLRKTIGLWAGPILFLIIFFSPDLDHWLFPDRNVWFFPDFDVEQPSVKTMAAIATLMAAWWITEAIPIPATALLPLVLFPLFGIMPADRMTRAGEIMPGVAKEYISYYIFLFLGGFLIAIAVEKWNLHKRIALHILKVIGGKPKMLVLGFMVSTAFLSMWLSNTATTMMMMPMALSLILLFDDLNEKRRSAEESVDPRSENFGLDLMLGIAYSASIGGLATLIGTPPNLAFVGILGQAFPEATPVTFANWIGFALPFSLVFLLIAWFVLTQAIYPLPQESPFSGKDFIRNELKGLGPITNEEVKVASVFSGVALLWMTRRDIVLGQGETPFTIHGWSYWLDKLFDHADLEPHSWMMDDSTVAIAMALLLFVIPAGRKTGKRLLDWEAAGKVPWGILLLFGGGLALAKGFGESGLSAWIGSELEGTLSRFGSLGMVATVVVVVTSLTELTSNTATANMTLPIVAEVSKAMALNPLMLMIATALAASCAFVLPVSTPPNAIVYGSGRVPILKMVKVGIIMDLVAVVLISAAVFTLGVLVYDTLGPIPEWAAQKLDH